MAVKLMLMMVCAASAIPVKRTPSLLPVPIHPALVASPGIFLTARDASFAMQLLWKSSEWKRRRLKILCRPRRDASSVAYPDYFAAQIAQADL